MPPWGIALALLSVGAFIAYLAWGSTGYGEYPFWWWFGWGVATAGGLLFIATFVGPLRDSYMLWSSGVAVVAILIGGMIGQQEEEFIPPFWLGVGVLSSNICLFVLGRVGSSTTHSAIGLAIIGALLIVWGHFRRDQGEPLYDLGYSAGLVSITLGAFLYTGVLYTPLEKLNLVDVPRLNESITLAEQRLQGYSEARVQATQCGSYIETEFGEDDASFTVMTNERTQAADAVNQSALDQLLKANPRIDKPFAVWTESDQTRVDTAAKTATQASADAQSAIDQIGAVCSLYLDIAKDYRRTILWTEIADWWQSEAYDLPTGRACYYGELVSVMMPDGTGSEQLISDQADIDGGFDFDSEGNNWKVFTYNDYVDMVNAGLIPPREGIGTSPVDVAEYLCGPGAPFAEGEVTILKEYGSLRLELEDEQDTFVGNYRYGTWCVLDPASGKYAEIAEDQERPATAEWCWHQPAGSSTSNYYWRRWQSDTWIYVQGPRRCVYCSPTSWTGDTLVPDQRMAETNKTDRSTLGPNDVGGGPGTGK